MRKSLLLPVFLLLSVSLKAQCYSPPCSCVDSTLINVYANSCTDGYVPVCGCDGHTYRNLCLATIEGGIVQNYPGSYVYGPCGNFDFDFVPDVVVPESNDPQYNGYGTLSIWCNTAPATALIQIFDIWGRLWYVRQEGISSNQYADVVPSIYMDGWQQGIYYVFVIINGEAQHKKILKANLH